MKIALLFDGLSALGKAPEVQLLDSIEAVESALLDWAAEVVRVPVTNDGRWVERVRKGKFDLVFNLCEGIDGEAVYEPMVISVLELLGVPFTGSSSWTTALTLRKNVVNGVLDRAGLPVPRWTHIRRGDDVSSVGFPAICKPVAEDASVGRSRQRDRRHRPYGVERCRWRRLRSLRFPHRPVRSPMASRSECKPGYLTGRWSRPDGGSRDGRIFRSDSKDLRSCARQTW